MPICRQYRSTTQGTCTKQGSPSLLLTAVYTPLPDESGRGTVQVYQGLGSYPRGKSRGRDAKPATIL